MAMIGRTRIPALAMNTQEGRRLMRGVRTSLRQLDRRRPIVLPDNFNDASDQPAAENNAGRIIFTDSSPKYSDGEEWRDFLASTTSFATPAFGFSTAAAAGSAATVVRSDSTLAIFDTTVPAALAATAATGSAAFAARRDHVHLFPTALRSTANASTLTLTDDGTNQTITGSLGQLTLASAADTLRLPKWIGAGVDPVVRDILTFSNTSSVAGTDLEAGVVGFLTYNDASTYSGREFWGFQGGVSTIGNPTYTNITVRGAQFWTQATDLVLSGTHSFTKRVGLEIVARNVRGTSVTSTDNFGIDILGWNLLNVSAAAYTNAAAIKALIPTLGGTIRRGVWVTTGTGNVGTEAANVEGFYCEDITRGTAQRANFYAEGATTGTPTDVYGFYQGTAHVVGTNRYGFRAAGATTGTPTLCVGFYADGHSVGTTQWAFYAAADESHMSGVQQDDSVKDVFGTGRDAELYYDGTNFIADPDVVGTGRLLIGATGDDDMLLNAIEIDGALNHDGTTVGLYGVAPTTRSAAYTPTNVTADRAYDANATTTDELADVLGTLIADLQLTGIIG